MKHFSKIWIGLLAGFFNCNNEESISFSNSPLIKFEDIKFVKGAKAFNLYPPDTILMTFDFSDGDADIGRQYDYYYETPPPFNPLFFINKVDGTQVSSDQLFNNIVSYSELLSYADRGQPPYDTLPTFKESPCDWLIYSKETTVDTLYSIKNQKSYNLDISITQDSPVGYVPFFKCADYDGLIPPITSYVETKRTDGPFIIILNSPFDGTIIYKMQIHGEYLGPARLKVSAKITDERGNESNTIESFPFDIY